MHDDTKKSPTFNDIPILLTTINEKLDIIVEWIQCGASQQDPHVILTIDEAVMLTGYSKSSIHTATSKDTIPHFKRGNKLFFFKDELIEWLKSDNRQKRGKRFLDNDSLKESVVTDSNIEAVSTAAEVANDTNSVAETIDSDSNQIEISASVSEAVATCKTPKILPSSEVASEADLKQKDLDDNYEDMSPESNPVSDADVNNFIGRPVIMDCIELQSGEPATASFPFFSIERLEDTIGTDEKTVIRFFNKIPHEQYYPICRIAEDKHGKRVANNTLCFEFALYDDAHQAALSINKYLSPIPSENN